MGSSKKIEPTKSSAPLSKKERQQALAKVEKEALKRSLSLLTQSLTNNIKNTTARDNLHAEIEAALLGKEAPVFKEDTSASAAINSSDNHNELCEVCDGGGEVLCCDTCNLVFHLVCVRPKMDEIPTGQWSCSYCIFEGIAEGDYDTARRCIRTMKDHARNYRASSEKPIQLRSEIDSSTMKEDITITRAGRHYVLRQNVRGQIVEIDRTPSLEDALLEVKRSKATKSKEKDTDVELWCIYCVDDPTITMCAFCGCKTCFGKHDSENLILCDSCDMEWHTYCLSPPLTEIPEGNWFCRDCIAQGKTFEDGDEDEGDDNDENEDFDGKNTGFMFASDSGYTSSISAMPEEMPVVRRPGRPKGSVGKKRAELLQAFYGGNQSAMQAALKARKKLPLLEKKKNKMAATSSYDILPVAQQVFVSEPVGVETACDIAVRSARRVLYQHELKNLASFRQWAPIHDLKDALEAFKSERSKLLKRLEGGDGPFYEEVDPIDIDLLEFSPEKDDIIKEEDLDGPLDDASFDLSKSDFGNDVDDDDILGIQDDLEDDAGDDGDDE